MNSLQSIDEAADDSIEVVPRIVANLVGNAVAALDADPGTSRRYLVLASAILRARSPHDSAHSSEYHSRGGLARWQLNRVIDYIERHLTEKIRGNDLAGLIDVSIGQLFRAFKASMGIAPLHYVVSRRLEFACSLMRTSSQPLSQIALMAGFCDQSHLSRAFRRVLGVAPAAWRRANAEDPEARFEAELPARGSQDGRRTMIHAR